MVEREMQELLWRYPQRLLNEPLKQFAWETSSSVGRADLVFEDRERRLLINRSEPRQTTSWGCSALTLSVP
jgi:hypothetical protein